MNWQVIDTSNSQKYESDDDYQTETDIEYEDIETTGWGDNAKKEATWDTLIDPSVKVKGGGIGSGDLHRRGDNFKPLSEAAILAQRLSKDIPSKESSKPKKSKKKKKHSVAAPPKPGTIFAGNMNRPYAPVVRPSAPARATIKDPSASTWGSLPLSDTPFWEKKQEPPKPTVPAAAAAAAPVASFTQQKAPVPPPPVNQFNQLNISQNANVTHEPVGSISFAPNSFQNNTSWGTQAPVEIRYSLLNPPILTPKIKTLTSQKLPAFSVPPTETDNKPAIIINTTTTKWNIEAPGFTPIAKSETPKWNVDAQGLTPLAKAEISKWNTSVPSFVPSTASTASTASTSISSSAQSSIPNPIFYNADAPAFVPTFVPPSPVKKILKITSPNATHSETTTAATTTTTSDTPHATSRVHLDQSLLCRHLDFKPSAAQQTHSEKSHAATIKEHQQQDHQLEAQTQPESTRGFEREPFLRIHLEICEGISTSILVEEGSNPEDLAEEFGITHKLKMTAKAKTNMTAFISQLIDEKKSKAKHGLLD